MYRFELQCCLDLCPGAGLLDLMAALILVFWEPLYCFHCGCTNLHSYETVWEGFLFSTPSPAFVICVLFFLIFEAESVTYGSSQARGRIEAAATATRDPSYICDPRHSSRQCWSLNPLREARDRTCILVDTTRVRITVSHNRNSCHLYTFWWWPFWLVWGGTSL